MTALLLLCLFGLTLACVAPQDTGSPPGDEAAFGSPAWTGPPVLGFALQRAADGSTYRLVDVTDADSDPPRVHATGTLELCEERLVELLLARHGDGLPNVEMPTFGGVQLWADVFWFAGWRIQRHVYTGHHRLLGAEDERHAWGSYASCRTAFEEVRIERDLELPSRHLVVLLHGLGRTRQTFATMRDALAEDGHWAVAAVGYPSTRRSVREHADGLNELLDSLQGVERVSFVTHSLGGIVVRTALALEGAERPAWRDRIELGRVAMLAPPSHGSQIARSLRDFLPFRAIVGPAGLDVATELDDLPPPPCPFGIVAAARGGEAGWNPLLDGPDDGVLTVEETRLEGAADFLVVPGAHTFLMRDEGVVRAVASFLASGAFGPVDGQDDQGEAPR